VKRLIPRCEPEYAWRQDGAKKGCMVKFNFVNNPMNDLQSKPIGVLSSIIAGFDRVAAKPQLILPILLLDLFLWFGPHISIEPLIPQDLALIDASTGEFISAQEAGFDYEEISEGINILSGLSVFPLGMPFNLVVGLGSLSPGIPSLMASLFPTETPIGKPAVVIVDNAGVALLIWAACLIVGIYLGVLLHRTIASQIAQDTDFSSSWITWGRSLILGLGALIVALLFALITALLIAISGFLFGGDIGWVMGATLMIAYLSIGAWMAIYLFFSIHGIVLKGFGLLRSMLESVFFVRMNFVSSVLFLFSVCGITLLFRRYVWSLPENESWLMVLAVFGHAFVAATLLVASYIFYQERREWLVAFMTSTAPAADDVKPPVA
jgi:hypothetical protein